MLVLVCQSETHGSDNRSKHGIWNNAEISPQTRHYNKRYPDLQVLAAASAKCLLEVDNFNHDARFLRWLADLDARVIFILQ